MADDKHIGTIQAPKTLYEAQVAIIAMVQAFDLATTALAEAKGGYQSTWIDPLEAEVSLQVKGTFGEGTSIREDVDAEATRKALDIVRMIFLRLRGRIPEA